MSQAKSAAVGVSCRILAKKNLELAAIDPSSCDVGALLTDCEQRRYRRTTPRTSWTRDTLGYPHNRNRDSHWLAVTQCGKRSLALLTNFSNNRDTRKLD